METIRNNRAKRAEFEKARRNLVIGFGTAFLIALVIGSNQSEKPEPLTLDTTSTAFPQYSNPQYSK